MHPARRALPRDNKTRRRAARAESPHPAAFALFVSLALLSGARAHAATADAQARFTEARTAFDAENYSQALALFEQALVLGMEGPAIHYNIGVAAYRSGDFARAERAFREVARTPAMAALAHYNLGLVALKRGDTRAARDEFARAASVDDERLAALATRRLEELPPEPPPADWSLYARAGAGYDDNVALRSESIEGSASGEDDAFGELLASASVAFGKDWHVDAAAALLDYMELDEFDQGVVSLGARRGFALDAWYLETGGYGTQMTLGHDVFERSAAVGLRASRTLGGGSLQAQFRASAVDGEGDFSGLSGARAELGAHYDWRWQSWSFGAHTRAELNDSEDDAFASRWVELGGLAQWSMSPRWTFSASGTLRRTRHPAQEVSPESWEDRRTTIRLGAVWKPWQQAQVFVRYEHERNTSPVESYDYERNWVAASVEYWR
ncbi:MAG TPA: tetratricopeptide repeat protein [Steroidobacteraceae bacterium]|nr:tetratricopeptide repeat protein [Steroidobacteraceae bacterium]